MSRPRKTTPVPDLAEIARRALCARGLKTGSVILAGVSGGADSTALACALAEASEREGWRLVLAHLHHGLRGRAADADLAFVRALARRLNARFISRRVRLSERPAGQSVEMAARDARRRFFTDAARHHGAAAIVLGHTADDQAETLLLRLARGASGRGLGGMAPVSELDGRPLIRPWLDVERRDIEAWLRARNQMWREDASNRGRDYLRNRVRHEILPLIERRLNPGARRARVRAAAALREDDALLTRIAARARARCATPDGGLKVPALIRAPAAVRRRILRDWLLERGIPPEDLDAALIARTEALLSQKDGVVVVTANRTLCRTARRLCLRATRRRATPRYRARQPIPGAVEIPEAGVRCEARFDRGYSAERPPGAGRLPATAWLDRGMASRATLHWRPWRAGDRLRPIGLSGTKKLQDIFTDDKTPVEWRRRLPVLVCGREVVWTPGYRIAARWAAAHAAAPTVRIRVLPLPTERENATVWRSDSTRNAVRKRE